MTLRIALRNIRRTIGDYGIYFVTIVLGVAVFYAFNSIGEQQVLFDIENSGRINIFETTQYMLSLVSYVIAFVLGFLVVYSNRFLVRRRKREFGTYLVLGMSSAQVSCIVLIETIIVGFISLAIGIVAGILLSQGLAFATAALFGTVIVDYRFVFSFDALILTLVCFAVIYVVVALFNLISVSRYRLISLLQAQNKSEKTPVRNPWACLIMFAISICLIAFSYVQLIEDGMQEIGTPQFVSATIFMLLGSLAFFWSLSGFVIAVLTRLRGVYLRGLVPFTVRQFAAKANTAWATLWVTCIMLFFAVTIFSVGMGLVDAFVGNIERYTPYDASFRADTYAILPEDELEEVAGDADVEANPFDLSQNTWDSIYTDAESYEFSALAKLQETMPHWDELVDDAAEAFFYRIPDRTFGELLDEAGVQWEGTLLDNAGTMNIEVVSLSDYNKIISLIDQAPLELDEDQYAIDNTLGASMDAARGVVGKGVEIDISGHKLSPLSEIQEVNICTSAMDSTAMAIIVPDSVVDTLRQNGALPYYSYVDAMYKNPGAETDEAMEDDLAVMLPAGGSADAADGSSASGQDEMEWVARPWPVSVFITGAEMRAQAGGLRLMITYLALYVGFILLVATAAILAIQQLTEVVDSASRYRMLSRLGCDTRMLTRSLFAQILIYFLAPLALAACHSVCAIGVLSKTLLEALGADVFTPIIMAGAFTLLIYGGYMLVTFLISRHVMCSSLATRPDSL